MRFKTSKVDSLNIVDAWGFLTACTTRRNEKKRSTHKVFATIGFLTAAVIAYKLINGMNGNGDALEGKFAIKRPNPVKPLSPMQAEQEMEVLVEA